MDKLITVFFIAIQSINCWASADDNPGRTETWILPFSELTTTEKELFGEFKNNLPSIVDVSGYDPKSIRRVINSCDGEPYNFLQKCRYYPDLNYKEVKLLLQLGANVNYQSTLGYYSGTALQLFCHFSHPSITAISLLYGADPNLQDDEGNTAAHFALRHSNIRYRHGHIRALIEIGNANLSIPNKNGEVPIEIYEEMKTRFSEEWAGLPELVYKPIDK